MLCCSPVLLDELEKARHGSLLQCLCKQQPACNNINETTDGRVSCILLHNCTQHAMLIVYNTKLSYDHGAVCYNCKLTPCCLQLKVAAMHAALATDSSSNTYLLLS